ncbi:hypothetical protein JTE90_001589 [Oedothorax gibbosus]|uniref:Ciliary microtubule inner protein 2A-C-like domain-containing protein n=1 Tax=Oedothorax gibbosus TaxID=931172 RepID=A0AAV6VNJ5_9ARAC|nr:hypothetical protein JTE90_001589 [Oedothorax gibbosus]
MRDYQYYIPGYTGFCPMLPYHIGESYGKATRQILRERPQDLLKDRLSKVRSRKFQRSSGDHASGYPNSYKENDRCRCGCGCVRCRCVNDSGDQCVGRHYKDSNAGRRWEKNESMKKTREPPDSCQPAYILVEAYAKSDCSSHKEHRPRKPSPPPPEKPKQVPVVLAQHCHHPLFIAAPCQPVIADPYCPRREESCCSSQPSNYRQQSSKQSRKGSCCDSSVRSHRQKVSDRKCCGESDNRTWTQGQTRKAHPFRECGVIPKYTGHITGIHFAIGESYGPSANRLLRKHHDKMKEKNIYYR